MDREKQKRKIKECKKEEREIQKERKKKYTLVKFENREKKYDKRKLNQRGKQLKSWRQ
jgi:hypothetical protein